MLERKLTVISHDFAIEESKLSRKFNRLLSLTWQPTHSIVTGRVLGNGYHACKERCYNQSSYRQKQRPERKHKGNSEVRDSLRGMGDFKYYLS